MIKPPQGELSYDGHQIRVFDFLTQKSTIHFAQDDVPKAFGVSGHVVGDYNFIRAFISAVAVSELRCRRGFLKNIFQFFLFAC